MVCEKTRCTYDELTETGSESRIIRARKVVTFLVVTLTESSIPELAMCLGNRKPSAIINYRNSVKKTVADKQAVVKMIKLRNEKINPSNHDLNMVLLIDELSIFLQRNYATTTNS